MGFNGQKLTSSTPDCKTEAVKSFDPVWEKELLMQDSHIGIDEVKEVMIVFKDASSGLLKHLHIGQITIPINCFLYKMEAKFCLPIESTYRMTEQLNGSIIHYGEVELLTELVDVENDNNKVKVKVDDNNSDCNTVRLKFSLFRSNSMCSFWPFKVLNSNNSNNNSGTNGRSNIPISGDIYFGYDYIHIKLQPGASNFLYGCKEFIDGNIYIDYDQISSDIVDLTESTVMVLITLNICISSPNQVSKGELLFVSKVLDLLIGPCHSVNLCDGVRNRILLHNERRAMMNVSCSLNNIKDTFKNSKKSVSSNTDHHMRFSPLKGQNTPLLQTFDQVFDLLAEIGYSLETKYSETLSLMATANSIGNVNKRLVNNYKNCLIVINIYYVLLSFLFRDVKFSKFSPEYDVYRIKAQVREQIKEIGLVDSIDNINNDEESDEKGTISDRFQDFLCLSLDNVRYFILLSFDQLQSDKNNFQICVNNLISAYHTELTKALATFSSSHTALRKIINVQERISFIHWIINNNEVFTQKLNDILCLALGCEFQSSRYLLDGKDLDKIIDYYGSSIQYETKMWVGKTFIMADKTKEKNNFNIPFDVEMVGDKYSSFLPESLRYQLNIYVEHCTNSILNENQKALLLTFDMFKAKYDDILKKDHPEGEVKPANVLDPSLFNVNQLYYFRMNLKVAEAVAHALVLLSAEYHRVLQMKHWDQVIINTCIYF